MLIVNMNLAERMVEKWVMIQPRLPNINLRGMDPRRGYRLFAPGTGTAFGAFTRATVSTPYNLRKTAYA
nr:hypothetical protein Q903MT_gene1871 [Picea sitchensis]